MKGPGKEKIEGKVKSAGKLEDNDKECKGIGARHGKGGRKVKYENEERCHKKRKIG
jgi:hypothetical protein